MKIALLVQPSLVISGGDQIINLIYESLKKKYDVSLICLLPSNLDNKIKRSLKFLYRYLKSFLSKYGNRPKLKRFNHLKNYDFVIVGWNEDCAALINSGFPNKKIIHICQSFETWASDIYSSRIIYQNKIHRLFVARWLQNYLKTNSLSSSFIGNCINDCFFKNQELIDFKKKKFITFLSHKGWYKNSIESLLFGEKISQKLNLPILQIGGSRGKENFVNLLTNLRPPQMRKVFDETKYLISLSHYEGMPLFVIEALSRGCIAILSNIPAHKEIYERYPNQVLIVNHAPFNFNDIDISVSNLQNLNFKFEKEKYNFYRSDNFIKIVLENIIKIVKS